MSAAGRRAIYLFPAGFPDVLAKRWVPLRSGRFARWTLPPDN